MPRAARAALLPLMLAVALQPASARIHGPDDRLLKSARPSPTPATFFRPQLPVVPTQPVPVSKTFSQFAISGDISAADATSVTVHGVNITCPAQLVVQFPANTDVWSKAIPGKPSLVGYEAQVFGNIVDEVHVAGLIYVSQRFANVGQGIITAINATDGTITVPSQQGASTVNIRLNDPKGRYGPKTTSPDDRFCVDPDNPTVTASTGYPMCVPVRGNAATCSRLNRPRITAPTSNPPGPWCRNFGQAGVPLNWIPVIGDFTPLALNHPALGLNEFICSAFIMPPVPNFVLSGIDSATSIVPPPTTAGNGSPDPGLMAPFAVGDFITWSGAIFPGSNVIWAHAITANVAIYTFPGTLPAYLALQEFSVSSGNAAAASVTGGAQEAKDRFSIEAVVTDVLTPVDFYAVDIANAVNGLMLPTSAATSQTAAPGTEVNRWMTTSEMTAGTSGPTVGAIRAAPVGGGVTTAHAFAPMNRQRLQANPAPPGYVDSPTRTYRAMYRSLCLPPARYLSGPPPNVPSNVFTLPTIAAPAVDAPVGTPLKLQQGTLTGPCVERMRTSSNILAGTYTAPAFVYLFPEALTPGDPPVPANMWDFDFLVSGEAGVYSSGGLFPHPW